MFSYITEKKNKLGTITPSSYHAADFLERTRPRKIENGQISNCGVRFSIEPKAYHQEHIKDIGNPNEPFGKFSFKFEHVDNPFSVFEGLTKVEPANDYFNRFNYAAAELVAGASEKEFIVSQLQEEAGTVNALQQRRDDYTGLNTTIDEELLSKEAGLKKVLAGIEEIGGDKVLETHTKFNRSHKEDVQNNLERLEVLRKTKEITGKRKKKDILPKIPDFLETEPVKRMITDIEKVKNTIQEKRSKRRLKKEASAGIQAAAETKEGDHSDTEETEITFSPAAESKKKPNFTESIEKKIGKVKQGLDTLVTANGYYNDKIRDEIEALPSKKGKSNFKTEYPDLYEKVKKYNELLTGKEQFSNSKLKTVAAFKKAIMETHNKAARKETFLHDKQNAVFRKKENAVLRKKAVVVTPSSPKEEKKKSIRITRAASASASAAEDK
jgi:hypothetical protein